MDRRTWGLATLILFAAPTLSAQEMTFSLDDTGGSADAPAGDPVAGDDGGAMDFGVIDTEEAVKEQARSKRAENDLIRTIQHRPFLRRKRAEFNPFLGSNVNDNLVNLFVAGGNLNFHLTEVMAIGVNGGYALGSETALFDRVIEDYQVFPQISKVLWYGTLHFQYAPIYGKFALFNSWIIPWDAYAVLGVGYTKTELDGHPTLAAGVGQRYFMNRWFTVNMELRDNIFNEEYPSGSELVHNLLFTAGVSFFIPPDFEYRTLR
ncbi:outer membrane beta-barrel domain-containing protein [Myxococcota bacterium]|nr:outer membrane beta-barrel domain-containing protein [Myxococcota bacterium]MBU1428966.1 outer membrane beta-barrel domain-containing protein [Myxococcota bacterium]MBU1899448.1 outer membrane beta-barrel domain-containing protein [Myxococcota bacterium]